MTREEHIAEAEKLLSTGYRHDTVDALVHAVLAVACLPAEPKPESEPVGVDEPKRLPWWSLGWLR